jgi:hypothetical protein
MFFRKTERQKGIEKLPQSIGIYGISACVIVQIWYYIFIN